MEKVDRSGDSASAKSVDTRTAFSEEAWRRDQLYVAPVIPSETSVLALAPEAKAGTAQPGSGVTLSRTTNDGIGVGPSLTTTVYRRAIDDHTSGTAHEMSYVVNPDHDPKHVPIFSPSFNPPGHRGEAPPNVFPPHITLPDGQVIGGLPVPGQGRPQTPNVPWSETGTGGTDNGGLNNPGVIPGMIPRAIPGLVPGAGGEVPGILPGNTIPGRGGPDTPIPVLVPKPETGGPGTGTDGLPLPPIKTPILPAPSGSETIPVLVPPKAGPNSGSETIPVLVPPKTGPNSGSDTPPVVAGPAETPGLPKPETAPLGEAPAKTGPGSTSDNSSPLPPVARVPVDTTPPVARGPVDTTPPVTKRPVDTTPPVARVPVDTIPPVVARSSEVIPAVTQKPVLPSEGGKSVVVTTAKPVEAITPVVKSTPTVDRSPVVVPPRALEVTAKSAVKVVEPSVLVSLKDVVKSALAIARSPERMPVVKDAALVVANAQKPTANEAARMPQKFVEAAIAIRAEKIAPVREIKAAAVPARTPEKFMAAIAAIRAERVVPVKGVSRTPQQKPGTKQDVIGSVPQKFVLSNPAVSKAARVLPAKDTAVIEKPATKSFVAPLAHIRAPHLVVPARETLPTRKPVTEIASTGKTAPKEFVIKDYALLQNGLLGKLFQAEKTNFRPEGKQQEAVRLPIAQKPVDDMVISKALPGRKNAPAGRVESVDIRSALREGVRLLQHEHKHAQPESISRTPSRAPAAISAETTPGLSETKPQTFTVHFKGDTSETDRRPTRLDLLMAVLAAASAISRTGRLERKGKKRRLVSESQNADEASPSLAIAAEILSRLGDDDDADGAADIFGDEGRAARVVRNRYLIQPGDTLISIAADQLGDEVLAWLLLDINVGAIHHQWNGNICVAELVGRQEIELPTPDEIAEFYKTRPARRYREKRLVSSVKQTEMDRELVFEAFSRIIGCRAEEQTA